MTKKAIHITDYDMKRLRALLRSSAQWSPEEKELAAALKAKLDSATVVPQKEVPPYLVTMNCHVRVTEMETGEDRDFWLAYPDEAGPGDHKVSVISEDGVAILGYKVGDQVKAAKTLKPLRIARIHYQPEDNQHYRL